MQRQEVRAQVEFACRVRAIERFELRARIDMAVPVMSLIASVRRSCSTGDHEQFGVLFAPARYHEGAAV